MTEIRIYYECLEQAFDYIMPLVQLVTDNYKTSIKLVKRPRKPDQLSKGVMYAIQSLTTPDILITAVTNNKEYPLILIELSEAVTTEDHELQRTYGAVAAYLSGMYYVKISGHKQSEKEFGGAEYNPYSTPKILIEKVAYEGFIIADWETETTDKCNLLRDNNLPGCPSPIPILNDTIHCVITSFLKSPNNWFSYAMTALKQTISYKNYRKRVDKAAGFQELLKAWKEREEKNSNLNKLRYFVRETWIGAKINRFSHAMDPDRGILTFISFVFSQSYTIYGIYALVRPRGSDVLKGKMNNLKSLQAKLKEALKIDEGGIPEWLANELKTVVSVAKRQNQEINFQPIWEKHKSKIVENKVVMTIAYFLDGLYLNYNGIKIYWDKYALLGNKNGNFIELIKNYFGFNKSSTPTSIEKVVEEVDEDEVTYTIVHRVLMPNKFRIVSISYPGSQGGGAILPEPEKGKAQPREYPDIIALQPEKELKTRVLLNESKGMFNEAGLQKDFDRIQRYKKQKKLQNALRETLILAKVIDSNDKIHEILIGVSFGLKSNTPTTWKPDEVDFIFRIVNREKWAIGIFNQYLRDLITNISGDTDLPQVYKIKSLEYCDENQIRFSI